MTDVHQDILIEFEARRARANPQLFQGMRDQDRQDAFVKEFVLRQGAAVILAPRVNRLHPEGENIFAGVDPIDVDRLDIEYIDGMLQVNVRALIEHEPSRQLLTKYGVEEERDVVFYVPFSELNRLGLVNDDRFRGLILGDLFEWDGTWYIVREAHRTSYHGLTDRYHLTAGFCTRYYHTATPRDCDGANSDLVPMAPPPSPSTSGA